MRHWRPVVAEKLLMETAGQESIAQVLLAEGECKGRATSVSLVISGA